MPASPLLDVRGLQLSADTATGSRVLVDGVDLRVEAGEALGLLGASGSGKSLTALSLLGLLPEGVRITGGSVRLDGEELVGQPERRLRKHRGGTVGYVFQDPYSALNPLQRVGTQIAQVVATHRPGLRREQRRAEVLRLLGAVELPDPARLARRHPHELSGGQRQRVLLAVALAGEPRLLVADEPTSALDVTVQEQIVALVRALARARGLSLLWISHDLLLARALCDRVAVLDAGRIVESGAPVALFREARHPRTRELVEAARAAGSATGAAAATEEPVCAVRDLSVRYPRAPGWFGARRGDAVTAVDGVSLDLQRGETLAVVGESGSGKSSLARALLRLLPHGVAGSVRLRLPGGPVDWLALSERAARPLRRHLSMVFQDPAAALDPRQRAWRAVAEPLEIHGEATAGERRRRAEALLEEVGLDPELGDRLPHQLSGGQCQRVGIARAVALDPVLVVCDEAVSALDTAVQGRVLALLRRLQEQRGVSYLFITHDLGVARRIAHRVAVMQAGRVVECGPAAEVLEAPAHPYTRRLLEAARSLHSCA